VTTATLPSSLVLRESDDIEHLQVVDEIRPRLAATVKPSGRRMPFGRMLHRGQPRYCA
jgi:hypothetical protein